MKKSIAAAVIAAAPLAAVIASAPAAEARPIPLGPVENLKSVELPDVPVDTKTVTGVLGDFGVKPQTHPI